MALPFISTLRPQLASGGRRRRRRNQQQDTSGFVVRRMPADGSCLFHSVGYIFEGKRRDVAPELRGRISDYILEHSATLAQRFGEAFVATHPYDVLAPDCWGGGVEIALFSQMFDAAITVFDVSSPHRLGTADFTTTGHETRRGFLLFDRGGNHYDLLAWLPSQEARKEDEVLTFNIDDDEATMSARACVEAEFGYPPTPLEPLPAMPSAALRLASSASASRREGEKEREKEQKVEAPTPSRSSLARGRSTERGKELAAEGIALFRVASAGGH